MSATPQAACALAPDRDLWQCRVDSWGPSDGLPQTQITSTAQTLDGFIWLSTLGGLVRFDGARFQSFNSTNTPSLATDRIWKLFVDRAGTLWVGTERGGFGTFSNGVFHRVSPPEAGWSCVRCFYQDASGDIWVGCNADGAKLWRVHNGKASRISLPGTWGVSGICAGPNGGVTCGSLGYGLIDVDPAGRATISKLNRWLPSWSISALARDRDGSLWCGSDGHGLVKINQAATAGGADTPGIRQVFTRANGLSSMNVNSLFVDASGIVWIGTDSAIDRWDGRTLVSFGRADGLPCAPVSGLNVDHEGSLWALSDNGICRFADTKFAPYEFKLDGSLLTPVDMAADIDGSLVCVSPDGIWRVKPRINRLSHQYLISRMPCVAVARTPTGIVALGKSGELWRLVGDKLENLTAAYSPALRGRFDADLLAWDGKDLVILGSLNTIRIHAGRVISVVPTPSRAFAFSWAPAGNDAVWVGTTCGLMRISRNKIEFHNSGLTPNAHVLSIYPRGDGTLWLATDKGLGLYKDDRISMFTKADGLPDDNLYVVNQRPDGNVWIGGYFGIDVVSTNRLLKRSPTDHAFVVCDRYAASDGVRFPPSATRPVVADGRVWFEGAHGLEATPTGDLRVGGTPPPVAIEAATVDGRSVLNTGNVIVPPGPGRLEIKYSALTYVAPEKVQFQYKLDGVDNAWIISDNERSVSYNNLSPGSYSFRVIACNSDGVWNREGARIKFTIRPHFYQTVWFRILCAIAAILATIVIIRARTSKIEERARELEMKVAERTAELSDANRTLVDLHEQLEARNEELEAQQMELEAQHEELQDTYQTLDEANRRLEALATTDGLTGLTNHRTFRERLDFEFDRAGRYDRDLSLILLDVDRFKDYNDTYGHQGGDDVLKQVAAILKQFAREGDCVARYGGEEFVVIAPETDFTGAIQLAERLRSAIEEAEWPQRNVTASFGVATMSVLPSEPSALISSADAALYASKRSGRNRVTHIREVEAALK